MSGLKLNHVKAIDAQLLGVNALQFLSNLGGPSVLHIDGHDNSRCRVIVTLLHGNEPSGIKAIHRLLSEGFVPQVNTKVVIASVVAALTEPVFTHRMLPNKRDLNRCFSYDSKDLQFQLAQSIAQCINLHAPEAVVDIHNTSGSGPSFSVSTQDSAQHKALASHFTHRFIYTDLRLGSIMEQNFGCPIVTIEAGGSQDDAADITALNGTRSFLNTHDVFDLKENLTVLAHPRRLEVSDACSLIFDDKACERTALTLRQDIESLNFARVPRHTCLGWMDKRHLSCLHLDRKNVALTNFFEIYDNQLRTKQDLILFMVTTRVDIAKSDCLFYFVVDVDKTH